MARGQGLSWFLVMSLLVNALCLPPSSTWYQGRRIYRDSEDNSVDTIDRNKDVIQNDAIDDTKVSSDEDFDDDFTSSNTSSGGGSNIFSLLNMASALLPSLSGNNNVKKNNDMVKKVIKEVIKRYQAQKIQNRQGIGDNVIDIDYATELKPPIFERQETEEDNNSDASDSNSEDSKEDNGGEESVEEPSGEKDGSKSKQDSASNASNGNADSDGDDNDSDYDEPEGDGQGGGILGLLAGLSGDGESDLGSLLAAVGGIVANLSGDGVDINAIIATGLGLFVGLLSDGDSNPGEIIASYLLTSLDTITGGGAQNNGAFFGKFLSTLLKGTSAARDEQSTDSGTPTNPFWKLKLDIMRAMLNFVISMAGLASSGSSG